MDREKIRGRKNIFRDRELEKRLSVSSKTFRRFNQNASAFHSKNRHHPTYDHHHIDNALQGTIANDIETSRPQ